MGAVNHRALSSSGEAAHTPAPAGGGGRGEGGHRQPCASGPRGRAKRRAARGRAAPPNEGRGRTTAPGPSEGSPTSRAAPVGATRTQQNNPVLLSEGGRNARTQQNLCFDGFVRLPRAELQRGVTRIGFAPKSDRKPKNGVAAMGGYYDTPPWVT